MDLAIHVIRGPYSRQSNLSALNFCKAALAKGHRVSMVFFSGDGVYTGSRLTIPPQDEIDLNRQWQDLVTTHGIELVTCISAALRRGVINASEAKRYGKDADNLAPEITLAGLGQLVEAGLEAERLITFGSQ